VSAVFFRNAGRSLQHLQKLFMVYCAGLHCNGANKAAMRLVDEGFSLATAVTKGASENTDGTEGGCEGAP
jgi:hypothetical protein